jgi:gliding motility-associated lipoprotein GldD
MRTPEALSTLLLLAVLTACGDEPVPKPRGWFRIDLPEKRYAYWEDEHSFGAELPAYARMVPRRQEGTSTWYDLRFPGQRATVHLTWTRVEGNVQDLIEDAHAFKGKHEARADRVARERVLRPDARVFGTIFDVEGDVASPAVFYLTDSTTHFLYGALYFDTRPNADSLAPVTQRMREDLRHIAGTLVWRTR